jgi:hypothetical protein
VILYILLAVGACASSLPYQTSAAPEASEIRMSWQDVGNICALTAAAIVIVYVSIRTLAVWSIG